MTQLGVRVVLDTQGTNQFLYWNTKELVEWVDNYISTPLLQTFTNIDTYYEAVAELDRRKEMLSIAN